MSKYEFPLPDTGEGLHEAEILAWMVEVGDLVNENDALVEIQTDKAVVEITSPVSGKVEALGAEQGETLKVGETLVHLTNVEQTLVDTNEEAQGDPPATSQNNNQRAETTVDMQEKPITKRVKAAPSIRKAAREAGVDLSLITPTGPSGRVLRKDLEKYLARKDDPVHMFTEVDKIVEEP